MLRATVNQICIEKGSKGADIREGFPEEVTFKVRHGGWVRDKHYSGRGKSKSRDQRKQGP